MKTFRLVLLLLTGAVPLAAQERGPVRVFFDCSGFFCDQQFYRSEIDWVDYVRDRTDADVHLLITRQFTGGGGREYTLEFLGRGDFSDLEHELSYTSPQTATRDEERTGLARVIRVGLVPFVARTSAIDGLDVQFERMGGDAGEASSEIDDPWDFWTFRTSLGGSMNGESRRSSRRVDGSVSAERVTDAWKIVLQAEGDQSRGRFDVDSVTTINTEEHSYGTEALVVRSLGPHWSTGGRAKAESSTRLNQDLTIRLAPAIEYSVYPYEFFNRRQFTFLYSVGLTYYNYTEETIFGEIAETLPNHSLRAGLDLNQPWGSANVSLEGNQFLHDPARFRLQWFNRLDVRLIRGLSANMHARLSYVRDQLFLPAGDADPEEVLLNLRQLETNYEYNVSLGLSYTFGSIFNTVINPRFGRR